MDVAVFLRFGPPDVCIQVKSFSHISEEGIEDTGLDFLIRMLLLGAECEGDEIQFHGEGLPGDRVDHTLIRTDGIQP
jgi:hypothetical protein